MKNQIMLFTDGSSFIGRNKKFYESSSGCSIYINGIHVLDLGKYHINGTNSLGELYAIQLGLDRLYDILSENSSLQNSNIIVVSDSDYVIKSLNTYIYSWIKHGINYKWTNSKFDEVAYQYIFKSIWNDYRKDNKYMMYDSKITFIHMRGHINQKVPKKIAYDNFIKKNSFNLLKASLDVSESEFDIFINRNHHVDKLADNIRIKKIAYYERMYDNTWIKKERKVNLKNGKIVIGPRNRRKGKRN